MRVIPAARLAAVLWLVEATASLAQSGRPIPPAPAPVVDSILPIDEAIRRFRAQLPGRATALVGGGRSRTDLVHRFGRALEASDTAALAAMLLSKAEFGYLYYPSSEYTGPPYRQSPDVVWLRMALVSEKGLRRLLARDAGTPLGDLAHRCDPQPTVQGANRIWTGCVLVPTAGRPRRLFGSILERGGRFKFLTYSSEY